MCVRVIAIRSDRDDIFIVFPDTPGIGNLQHICACNLSICLFEGNEPKCFNFSPNIYTIDNMQYIYACIIAYLVIWRGEDWFLILVHIFAYLII